MSYETVTEEWFLGNSLSLSYSPPPYVLGEGHLFSKLYNDSYGILNWPLLTFSKIEPEALLKKWLVILLQSLAMLHLETIICIKGRELNPPGLIPVSLLLQVVLFQRWGTLAWGGHVAELRSIWFIVFTYGHLGGSGRACLTESLLTSVPAPCFVHLVAKGKIIGCSYLKPLILSRCSEWNPVSSKFTRSRWFNSGLPCRFHHLCSCSRLVPHCCTLLCLSFHNPSKFRSSARHALSSGLCFPLALFLTLILFYSHLKVTAFGNPVSRSHLGLCCYCVQ